MAAARESIWRKRSTGHRLNHMYPEADAPPPYSHLNDAWMKAYYAILGAIGVLTDGIHQTPHTAGKRRRSSALSERVSRCPFWRSGRRLAPT